MCSTISSKYPLTELNHSLKLKKVEIVAIVHYEFYCEICHLRLLKICQLALTSGNYRQLFQNAKMGEKTCGIFQP